MSVGIPAIDEDHKQFIVLINELNRSITEGKNQAEIKQRLHLIVDDAERHFRQEEKLFNEWKYPDSYDHANIHAQVLKSLKTILAEFVPYGSDSGWVNAGLRIRDLLINHILAEDMKYAEFYRKTFGAAPPEKI